MDMLATLAATDLPLMLIFFVAAVALILIDYFFPVDYPAYFGYLLFSLGMFWAVPFGPLLSLVCVLAIFALLLVLHLVWFRRFLTNAPSARRR